MLRTIEGFKRFNVRRIQIILNTLIYTNVLIYLKILVYFKLFQKYNFETIYSANTIKESLSTEFTSTTGTRFGEGVANLFEKCGTILK